MQELKAVSAIANWFGDEKPVAAVEIIRDKTFRVVFSYMQGKLEIAVPVIDYEHGKAIAEAFNR